MQFCSTGDRNDPRFLSQKPGERNLGTCSILSSCDFAKQVNQSLVRFPRLRREAWHDISEVGAVEGRVLIDCAGEEALA